MIVTDRRKLTDMERYEAEVAALAGRWPWRSLRQVLSAVEAERAATKAWLDEVRSRLGLITADE